MKRMISRKSHSWWWDSHISRKNSKWLEENLEKMDQSVKQMLKLIEEEGESFAKKAEVYYQRRPELISQVEDFYRMYRALAERYDQVTGDLRKNIRSELRSQVSGSGSDHVSDPPSPSSIHSLEVTPESKPQPPKPSPRAAGFDFFLGSGGSSDLSRKGSDGSYSSSSECDSESEFDDGNEVNGDGISSRLQQKIHELEDELRETREKVKRQGEKICHDHCNSKILSLEEELSTANEKLHCAETEIMVLKNKLEETNISLETMETELRSEKEKVLNLDEHVAMLQNAVLAYKYEILVLKEATEVTTKQFQTELLNRDIQIAECKTELVNSKEKFLQQKSSLEAGIAYLEGVNMELKEETEKMLLEKLSLESHLSELQVVIQELQVSTSSSIENVSREKLALESEVLALSQSNASLEGKINILDDQVRQLDADRIQACEESGKHITELNKKLDALKLRVDMLTAEKDQLTAKVDSLTNDVRSRDGQIIQMDEHLHRLQLENAKLIIELEEGRKASLDLKSRMKDLEEEVDRQKVVISDGAEGKREAIRQLCFSLEHYRDGYHQLRQLLQCHRRSPIAAS
ncbi:protein NETWORKED 4B-like [Musa acuminata AAA Group]|uniref:protein NETWORKED 4B-like n=1 Tax=Musa acuminata AAA Group TaxID=214697 RepID=UPI0031D05560